MNRREFVKLLGRATVASGIALAVGLPEGALVAGLPEVSGEPGGPNSGEGPSGMSSEKLARWDGNAWESWRYGPDGTLYLSGDFVTAGPGE